MVGLSRFGEMLQHPLVVVVVAAAGCGLAPLNPSFFFFFESLRVLVLLFCLSSVLFLFRRVPTVFYFLFYF